MEAQRKSERLATIKRIVAGRNAPPAASERPRPPPGYRPQGRRIPLFGRAYDSPPARMPNPVFRVIPR